MHNRALHSLWAFPLQGFVGLLSSSTVVDLCVGAVVGILVEGSGVGIFVEGSGVVILVEGSGVGILVEGSGVGTSEGDGLEVTKSSDAQISSVGQFA